MKLQKTRHATHLLQVHLIFTSWHQHNIFKEEHISFLKRVAEETIGEMGGTLEDFKGKGNYIYLHIQYPPKWAVSVMVNNLKGKTSRMIRRDMPDIREITKEKNTLWCRDYFAQCSCEIEDEIIAKFITDTTRG